MPVASSSRKAQRQPRTWNQVTIHDKESNIRLETEDGCNSLILINSLKLYRSKGRFVFHAQILRLLFDATVLEQGLYAKILSR